MRFKSCDDFDKIYLTKNGTFRMKGDTHTYYDHKCDVCGDIFLGRSKKSKYCSSGNCRLSGKDHFNYGNIHSIETKEKISKAVGGKNHPNYGKKLAGIIKCKGIGKNISYDAVYEKLSWCEDVRRSPENFHVLQVKCTYCGKWYSPLKYQVNNRLKNVDIDGQKFYCSDGCRQACPTYSRNGRRVVPRGYRSDTSREVQAELRQMVFQRDIYQCIKCGATESLHCHHIEGIRWSPLESADIDACITVCKNCHKAIHQKEGCGYHDMMCLEAI